MGQVVLVSSDNAAAAAGALFRAKLAASGCVPRGLGGSPPAHPALIQVKHWMFNKP